jgi:hypothetical protein
MLAASFGLLYEGVDTPKRNSPKVTSMGGAIQKEVERR